MNKGKYSIITILELSQLMMRLSVNMDSTLSSKLDWKLYQSKQGLVNIEKLMQHRNEVMLNRLCIWMGNHFGIPNIITCSQPCVRLRNVGKLKKAAIVLISSSRLNSVVPGQ